MSKRVTLQDVAKTAGVTVSTAHKALHGQKGVSEKKRREILEVDHLLGKALLQLLEQIQEIIF